MISELAKMGYELLMSNKINLCSVPS